MRWCERNTLSENMMGGMEITFFAAPGQNIKLIFYGILGVVVYVKKNLSFLCCFFFFFFLFLLQFLSFAFKHNCDWWSKLIEVLRLSSMVTCDIITISVCRNLRYIFHKHTYIVTVFSLVVCFTAIHILYNQSQWSLWDLNETVFNSFHNHLNA